MLTHKGTSTFSLLQSLKKDDFYLFAYLDEVRIRFEQVEPQVLAFVPEEGRFERLKAEAQELLEKFPDPQSRPPLFGLVIGVKDIFHVDGFTTRAGSKVPPDAILGEEAECVTQLKEAGALVLGKTVTTEFAYFAPGPTRNPHNPSHTPGGSSSGSAAAVAAGLVPMAFGTQTIGSISRPASFCGVVGFKPSFGRISTRGVIPLSQSLDHIGMFTSDVKTAKLVASELIHDYVEPETLTASLVFGVPEGPYLKKANEEMVEHFETILNRLMENRFKIKRVPAFPDIEAIIERHNLITAAEAAQNHAEWYEKYKDLYHPKTVELIERGQKVAPEYLETALTGREKLRQELIDIMEEAGIDMWLSPSAPGAAPKGLDSTGNPVMNLPWTHSGLPTLSLPSGLNRQGLPLGLQVAAGWYQDELLFSYGTLIQAAML